ncbi:MAG TPA: FtsQ-type POTRA domain-containing protein [Gemmatimonadaceae bacterium]|nr:FtsQ-type POTRA domain-containing protein [Gemmatimonadaceae bacterium]
MTSGPARDDEAPVARRIPRLRLALAGIAALLLVSLPLWAPLLLRQMDFFRVRRLEITGTRYIATSDIVARVNVDTTRSVWDPTGPVADRVRSHPGVQTVDVRRKLPNTLVITVTEHQPIALVPGPQGFRVYDARGVALPVDPTRVLVDAPVLARADTALLRLLAALRADLPSLYTRVSELRRVGAHELLFFLGDQPVRAMSTVTIDDLNQIPSVEADLQKRAARAVELDLRYSGQIVARLQ